MKTRKVAAADWTASCVATASGQRRAITAKTDAACATNVAANAKNAVNGRALSVRKRIVGTRRRRDWCRPPNVCSRWRVQNKKTARGAAP